MEALDLTRGELIVIAFLFFVVVAAPWVPRLGSWIAERLGGGEPPPA
ncbi:MAG: hypothetical protein KIT72_01415 [Polyangiaceae bacterium]|nr:hypothetical protein [Polyangiaceae bacterium]MCW5789055.1 hypothetical protein [Polyangiaceae bacterium]